MQLFQWNIYLATEYLSVGLKSIIMSKTKENIASGQLEIRKK